MASDVYREANAPKNSKETKAYSLGTLSLSRKRGSLCYSTHLPNKAEIIHHTSTRPGCQVAAWTVKTRPLNRFLSIALNVLRYVGYHEGDT
jgi:cell division FtsZ-interacting protein ZapD